MSKFEAIHFDMDGVIADTEPFHAQAEMQTCIENGFDVDPKEWKDFAGRTAMDIFTYLVNNFGDPSVHSAEELIGRKTEIFLEITKDKIQPIYGILDFLQWARSNHQVMTLVTSSNRRTQQHIVDRFNIGDYFDHIITGNDIKNGKPHPEPYEKAIKFSGIDGSRSIVIEDSKSGIKSAIDAGCMVLGIATSHTPEELKEANPTLIAVDYADARRQIESLRVS